MYLYGLAFALLLLFSLLVAHCLSSISSLQKQVTNINIANAQHDARLNFLLG
jgi:hypothetical protein